MKLVVHMNEQTTKQVKGFLTCCAKIGGNSLDPQARVGRWRCSYVGGHLQARCS